MFFGMRMSNFVRLLVAANAFMFFVSLAFPVLSFYYLALIPDRILQTPWTIVTSMFMHSDIWHIFFNVFFGIIMFGSFLESIVGVKEFRKVYFIGGVFASLSYLFTSLVFNIPPPNIPAVGASGAIFAVMGMLVVLRPHQIIYFNLIFPMPLYIWASFYVFYSLFEMMGTMGSIAHNAHLGGLLFGLAYGYYYKKKNSQTQYVYGVTYRYQ
ncbi:MAG: rhomboid family intramembrane serine protease [Candidatus Altiarchaeota archaeon]